MNSRRNRLPMSRVHMILLWPRWQQWNKYTNAFKEEKWIQKKLSMGMYKPTYVMIEQPGIAHHSSKNTMVPWGNFYHLLLQHKYQFFGACWKSCVDLPWFLPRWYNLFLSLSSFILRVIFLCFGCKSIDLEVVLSVDANPSTCKWCWC